jgi:hypothetical protein
LQKIVELNALEKPPYTQNDKYYEHKYNEYLKQFRQACVPRNPSLRSHEQAFLLARELSPGSSVASPTSEKAVEVYYNHASWISYQQEMRLMAKCEVYFRIAYKVSSAQSCWTPDSHVSEDY